MAAEGPAVEHQDGEPFRSRIDGRGKAAGPATDDSDVIDLVRIERADQAKATGQLVLGRIAQQLPIRTQDNRQFFRSE